MNIVTIDYYLTCDDVINTEIDGDETLLDADVVICEPSNIDRIWKQYVQTGNDNVPRVYSPHSDRARNTLQSRKGEIKSLLDNGKIIIIFLQPVSGFKGEVNNKNQYDIVTNYDFLPMRQDYFLNRIKSGSGNSKGSLKLNVGANLFTQYFSAFKDEITYNAYYDFDASDNPEYFIVNKANRPVGAVHKVSEGLIVFLPPIPHVIENNKLIGVIKGCTKQILNKHTLTPAPPWIKDYTLIGETDFDKQSSEIQQKIEKLESQKIEVEEKKNQITQFKRLLYEQGFELEDLVIKAFHLFGFKAENRKQDDLEHDIIFESEEGRGLAELEGKDNDAVHVSKLDQLNRAVDEDFELTGNYPQGILIGNHYRFTKPENRKQAFTEKVHIVAKKKSFGLLNTCEIFYAVDYILRHPDDDEFKLSCRTKILKTVGEEISLMEK